MKKLKNVFKFILKEFVYGGHLQSLGAASIVFVSAVLLGVEITWDILAVTYLISYLVYLYNRFEEIEIDNLTNFQRTQHLKIYLKKMPIIFYFLIFVLVGSLIYFTNFWGFAFGLLLLIPGLLYTTIFKKTTKKIPLFKNLYVSLSFSLLVFFLIIYYSYSLTASLIISAFIFAFFVFLKTLIMQIFFDIKDIESDQKQGLRTFPVLFGKKSTFNVLKISSVLVTMSTLIIFSFCLDIFPKPMIMLLLTIPFNFYCFRLAERQKYLGYILGSGEFVLWTILILIGKNL